MGLVNGCLRRAPIHHGQPAGAAAGQHLEAPALALKRPLRSQLLEDGEAMDANGFANGDILISDGTHLGGLINAGDRAGDEAMVPQTLLSMVTGSPFTDAILKDRTAVRLCG